MAGGCTAPRTPDVDTFECGKFMVPLARLFSTSSVSAVYYVDSCDYNI